MAIDTILTIVIPILLLLLFMFCFLSFYVCYLQKIAQKSTWYTVHEKKFCYSLKITFVTEINHSFFHFNVSQRINAVRWCTDETAKLSKYKIKYYIKHWRKILRCYSLLFSGKLRQTFNMIFVDFKKIYKWISVMQSKVVYFYQLRSKNKAN